MKPSEVCSNSCIFTLFADQPFECRRSWQCKTCGCLFRKLSPTSRANVSVKLYTFTTFTFSRLSSLSLDCLYWFSEGAHTRCVPHLKPPFLRPPCKISEHTRLHIGGKDIEWNKRTHRTHKRHTAYESKKSRSKSEATLQLQTRQWQRWKWTTVALTQCSNASLG